MADRILRSLSLAQCVSKPLLYRSSACSCSTHLPHDAAADMVRHQEMAQRLYRKLFVRPLRKPHLDDLQPCNQPAYGKLTGIFNDTPAPCMFGNAHLHVAGGQFIRRLSMFTGGHHQLMNAASAEKHASHKRKTQLKILEEWNKRSDQDFLRIDNILYKYKRKELEQTGKGMPPCPDIGKPEGTKKKEKKKKKGGCAKAKVKCGAIEASLNELLGKQHQVVAGEGGDSDNNEPMLFPAAVPMDNKMAHTLFPVKANAIMRRLFSTATNMTHGIWNKEEDGKRIEEDSEDGQGARKHVLHVMKQLPRFIPMKIPDHAMMRPSSSNDVPLRRLKKRECVS